MPYITPASEKLGVAGLIFENVVAVGLGLIDMALCELLLALDLSTPLTLLIDPMPLLGMAKNAGLGFPKRVKGSTSS